MSDQHPDPAGRATVAIRSIETAVPPTVIRQPDIREVFATQPGITGLGARMIRSVFDATAIEARHTVIAELEGAPLAPAPASAAGPALFRDPATGELRCPSTGVRNEVYRRLAPELFLSAAARALEAAPGLEAADVSHVVTVSCTGCYAPGPDIAVVRGLGLAPSTQRYHLGFMGCYAAFPALRAAAAFCRADPDAVVLVVCAELCTIHLQSSNDPDSILSSAVFADGAAAAVVTARPAPDGQPVLDLDAFATTLTPTGEQDMAWTIGDAGFDMTLSSYVPRIISQHIEGALAPLLAGDPTVVGPPSAGIERWAVHPGGRSILDKVQAALGLTDDQLEPSREVLREFGNISSATILFVLRRILHKASTDAPERVCAMAFGPGLTVESALLTRRTPG